MSHLNGSINSDIHSLDQGTKTLRVKLKTF